MNNHSDNKILDFDKINYKSDDKLSDYQRKKNKERALKRAIDHIHNNCDWGWRLWN